MPVSPLGGPDPESVREFALDDAAAAAPFDLAGCPAYPQPLNQVQHQPLRFCADCTVETVETRCFVCDGPTTETMPAGWYRGAVEIERTVIPFAVEHPIVPIGTLPGQA